MMNCERFEPMRRLGLALVLLLGLSPLIIAQAPTELALTATTTLAFVSADRGRELISAEDDFIRHVQPLELQLRLESSAPVSKEKYLQSLQDGVREWKPSEVSAVSKSIQELGEKLMPYDVPLPETISLIRVSASTEGNAPHCRGASIVLPDSFIAVPADMTRILAHELFHVMSSHNSELRDHLYAIIGFTPCDEIEWPEQLDGRRLTNPDAPIHRHYIELAIPGRDGKVPFAPITLCQSKDYRPGGLFRNLDFKLLELERMAEGLVPKVSQGELRLISPREAPDYGRQIGRNTGYIIHPEETLADNFTLLVLGGSRIPDAWLIDKLSERLKR